MKKKVSKYLIYGLIDPITGELRYVGRSSSGFNRPRQHLCPSVYNTEHNYCHNWIKSLVKKNQRAEIIVLEQFKSELELNDAEQFWISYYKGIGSRLTNLTDGGFGFSDYVRLESRKPFYEVFTGKEYQTLSEAEIDLGVNNSHISMVLTGKLRHAQRYVFRYVGQKFEFDGTKSEYFDIPKKRRSDSRDFVEVSSGKIFTSLKSAGSYFNINYKLISGVLAGGKKSTNGYNFVYLSEYNPNKIYKKYENKIKKIKEVTSGMTFSTVTEACKFYKIPSTTLRRYLNNKQPINGLEFIYG